MHIRRLRIRNFRCIADLDLALEPETVLIGPNGTGKTAILESIRLALSRRWGQRGTGFTEYDVHLKNAGADPKTSDGICLELEFAESVAGEWPGDVITDLTSITAVDPDTGVNSITLRVSCAYDQGSGTLVPSWEFLGADRKPLPGDAARRTNLEDLFRYVPVFYLSALRDADDEFSNRSQFWGRLLRAMRIPAELEASVQTALDQLNTQLHAAEPKLAAITGALSGITKLTDAGSAGEVSLRPLPLRTWDVLSRTEVVLRTAGDKPWLPLLRHGQGLQSLSILFLFEAFVGVLLKETYKPDSSPVLGLEEPETHLHPHAARGLWSHVLRLPGQKIVTTHSPFFVQQVPLRQLRLMRLAANGISVHWLPRTFSATVPLNDSLKALAASEGLSYHPLTGLLVVPGALTEATYRKLLTAYGSHAERQEAEGRLRRLRDESARYVTDEELRQLETWALRIRGEIFFARRWLLVEGQSEYLILRAIALAIGYDLDASGVSIIDCQNNGNPKLFAALARALDVPWAALFDNDAAGRKYLTDIASRGIPQADVNARCRLLPAGDLEQQLMGDVPAHMRDILIRLGYQDSAGVPSDEAIRRLRKEKVAYAGHLAADIQALPAVRDALNQIFRDTLRLLRNL